MIFIVCGGEHTLLVGRKSAQLIIVDCLVDVFHQIHRWYKKQVIMGIVPASSRLRGGGGADRDRPPSFWNFYAVPTAKRWRRWIPPKANNGFQMYAYKCRRTSNVRIQHMYDVNIQMSLNLLGPLSDNHYLYQNHCRKLNFNHGWNRPSYLSKSSVNIINFKNLL